MRYLGGTDYHKKLKEVTKMLSMYIHYIKVALDPTYKRKEFISKLWRMYTYGQDKRDITLQWKENRRGGKDRREQHKTELINTKNRRAAERRANSTVQLDFFNLLDVDKKKGGRK